MRQPPASWIAAFLATLCVALAWGAYRAAQPPDGVAAAGQGEIEPAASALEIAAEPEFAMPPAELYAAITERPLFASSRRPAVGEALIAASPRGTPEAILRGIVAAGDRRTALLAPTGGGDMLRLRENDQLNGWRLVEIASGHVIFRLGDDEVRLDLTFEQPPPSVGVEARRRRQRPAGGQPEPPPPGGDEAGAARQRN